MSGISTRWGRFLRNPIGGAIVSAVSLTFVFWADCALAQITPDGTLPNNSIVTPDGSTLNINGGTQAGGNLFHSFQQFSVPTGSAAIFNNAADIQNIFGRVTGGSVSNIDGIIRTEGTANLFLINPSGIIFGRNASLNIGGSFVATTASAIGFGDRGFFSASAPNNPEVLIVNPSAFFFNQITAASIENNSVADAGLDPSSAFTAMGLRVPDGKSLLLIGGNIKIEGGGLYAFGGRVELGGVSGAGTIGLNGDGNNLLSLNFPDSVKRSDVSLSNGARVNVTAGNGGSIAVNVRNLEIVESLLGAGIGKGLGSNSSKAGNIEVNATGIINLNNQSLISNSVLPEANGQGGDVNISAGTLQVEGGTQVSANTLGVGKGGSLTVNAQDVQIIGTTADGQFPSSLSASAEPNSTGNAGNLTIKTNTLLIKDGAEVGTSTFGVGKGGSLTVDAQNVQIIGTTADGQFPSGLSARASSNSIGNAGDLTIKTSTLLVKDGAQVSVSTFGVGKGGSLTVDAQNVQLVGTSADGQISSGLFASAGRNLTGDGGDLTITTNTLIVRDGAQVFTGTFSTGKGGSLTVDAQDVQIIGTTADGQFPSGLFASAEPNSTGDAGNLTIKTNTLLVKDRAQIGADTFGEGKGGSLTIDAQDVQIIGTSNDGQARSGLFASAQPNSTGDAGDLIIKTNTLLIQDRAGVAVQSFGTGTAGNMTLNARSIRLNNLALLTANTRSAKVNLNREQATININSRDLIVRGGSKITTNATGENVIGGNINIDTDFLIAAENSDISANSENFRGGNVRINAQGIFGTQFRDVESDRTSDITATGASPEFNGNVEIITPDIDPNNGLINLPAVPLDTEVSQVCQPRTAENQSSFTITGRGGLPPNPRTEPLSSDAVIVDWVTLNPNSNNRSTPTVTSKPTAPAPPPIVEATGWMLNQKGEVVLTANAPTTAPHSPWFNPASCTTSKS